MMLGDIDFKKKPIKPQLFLCKPNKQIISKLNEAHHITYNPKLGALNELKFTIPVFLDKHHTIERNENVDIIRGRYLIKLVLDKYEEYFVINQISKQGKDDEESLDIQTLSLGYELNDKIIRDLEVESKTATELMNLVLVDTNWKVGYVDSEFNLKYRGLKISSNAVLEIVFDIAKTFNALTVWDTDKREVSLYKPDNTGQNKGFKIKYGKYLASINQEENSEEIITRLKLYGKDGISIHAINPLGTSYIEDLTYFIYPYEEEKNYTTQVISSTDILADWSYDTDKWVAEDIPFTTDGVTETLQFVKLNVSEPQRNIIFNPSALSNKNYKVSGTLYAQNDDSVFGFVVRYKDANNYYYIGYESGKIDGGLGWGNNHFRIYKVVNGVTTLLAQTDKISGWSNSVRYNMSVETDNDLIKVKIDNVLVLYAQDNELTEGSYGFYGESQIFDVTNVQVQNKEYTVLSHSEYMSDELCHHILEYNALSQTQKTTFENLRGLKTTYNGILDVKENELFELNTQLKILLNERDILNTRIAEMVDAIDNADNRLQDTALLQNDYESLLAELNAKLAEIQAKKTEVQNKEAEIVVEQDKLNKVDADILSLKILLDVQNNFTTELLYERKQYIIEKEWQDNNIEDPNDLLTEGIKVFNELREQKITAKIESVNFLGMITEQINWDKLGLGDVIGIDHERLKVVLQAKLTEIEYNFEDDDIQLTITNVKDIYANKDKFLDMLYKSYNSSTQVSIEKWKWDLSLENHGAINDIINNKWDANKQAIVGAKDQVVEFSDRGLIIRDPNDPNTYLVGLNGMIAITDDGGNTWKHAITKNGIVGEYIYGKVFMGVNLAIEDEHGIVKWQGSKGEIFDRTGKLVMKLGLVQETPTECFGLMAFNDITRVKVTDCEGFVIDRKNLAKPDGWEKILWADQSTGTLYTHDLVAENVKIVNDIGDTILDAENHYLDLGDFTKIVMDNKFTTLEKMQVITELYKIHSAYKRMLEQAEEYKRSNRDDVFNIDSQFFTSTPSTTDRLSTVALTNAYTALINYIATYVKVVTVDPLDIDVNDPMTEQTSVIPSRSEFILKFKTYYDEEKNLRNAIEDSMFYSSLNMGKFYNNIVIGNHGFIALRNDGKYRAFLNATNGLALQRWEVDKWVNKVYASIGSTEYDDGTLIAEDLVAKRLQIVTSKGKVLLDVNSLYFDFSVLDGIILDNVIMSPEKITLLNQYKSISQQYATLKEQISKYATTIYSDRDSSYLGLDDAKTALNNAGSDLDAKYNSLTNYMSPVWVDMNATTNIVDDLLSTRTAFHLVWEDFYKTYEVARNRLADFLEKSSLQLGRNYNNTVIDAINGVVVTRGNMKNRTTLNATDGIVIERNDGTATAPSWTKVFYVDTDGDLYAQDVKAKSLSILSAKIGEGIILDELTGITINGQHGEQIKLNANEGISISVNNDQRLWIDTNGYLRAKKIIISEDDLPPVELPDGSYISKLTVSAVRTLENANPQDYVYVYNQNIKFLTGNGSATDITKMEIYIDDPNGQFNGVPVIRMGQGNGTGIQEIGYIVKDVSEWRWQYLNANGQSEIAFPNSGDAIRIQGLGSIVRIKSDTRIRLEVDANNYIDVSPSGVKVVGIRIDLN